SVIARQHNAEDSPAIRFRLKIQRASQVVYDPRRNWQPQTGPFLLRAEKRFEQTLLYLGPDAGPIILHLDDANPRHLAFERGLFFPRSQNDFSMVFNALGGILHKVYQHLFELELVAVKLRLGRRLDLELHGLAL